MNVKHKASVIQPGSTIGLFGSGQLGRMFAIAAKQMGYRLHVYSPSYDSPAGQVADLEIQASFDDLQRVERFSSQVDVVTLEFENIPVSAVQAAEKFAPVRPGPRVLHIIQNRVREKTFLQQTGLPVAGFRAVRSLRDLLQAGNELMPAVLKTSECGYDGKGQVIVRRPQDLESAWKKLNTEEAILEELIDFDCEISVVAARNQAGEFAAYQPIQNQHRNHILDVSISPSGLEHSLANDAIEIARSVLDELQAVGVLCVEFFVTRHGQLVVNEIAPRPHNSGHLTIDAHWTSQFEQQVRAVCGLGLGSTRQLRPSAMANLLGECWTSGMPNWAHALSLPEIKLHLYGKGVPEPGRKMGHLTALANDPWEAAQRALAARKRLGFGTEKNGPAGVKQSLSNDVPHLQISRFHQ